MRAYRQWILWRLEWKKDDVDHLSKPTKVPYIPRPNSGKASVTDPSTWGTFEEATGAPLTSTEVVEHDAPLTGFTGIGFVLTKGDPFVFVDLDDTHGDQEAYEAQLKIYAAFNSYAELSPSGSGCHIIAKGNLVHGRRRSNVELYDNERYMTMTGNVIKNLPIADCQHFIDILFEELGGDIQQFVVEDSAQVLSDDDLMNMAAGAVNGEKFQNLYIGNWQQYYSSQSEADFALVDILAFYSSNIAQIDRLFLASALGQRDKAQRAKYRHYMINKSFDRKLPKIDLDGFNNQFLATFNEKKGATAGNSVAATEPGRSSDTLSASTAAPTNGVAAGPAISHGSSMEVNAFPPGLIGEVANYFLASAPRPVPEIALAGAIGFLAGLTGRAYNTYTGAGLNQYILLLAQTGVGKDAIVDGVNSLWNEVAKTAPTINDYKGPGELVSSAGIIKWLDKKPCSLCILGEFGKKMKEMTAPHVSPHLISLGRVLLQIYTKSGAKGVFDPMAYSDKDKNTPPLVRPSLTIIGESVPDSFYESLDESMIVDGLLPRFMIFEYKGNRSYFNKNSVGMVPPFSLVQKISDLVAHCSGLQSRQTVQEVPATRDAMAEFDKFDVWTTDAINASKNVEVNRDLWNRAHLKSLKLAALQAVCINPFDPLVTIDMAQYAINMMVHQTERLIAKFETGTVGQTGGSEGKQLRDVIHAIATYRTQPYSKYAKYGGTEEMHAQGVITEAHIQRRVINMASFRHDRMGPTAALKRTIKTLLDADELREMPKQQMVEKFGHGPRAFVVTNPARFLEKFDD